MRSLTGLDLTRTNAVCGATALPSIGAHFVAPVHYLGHLSDTDVGQLRWLTLAVCVNYFLGLNLTLLCFSNNWEYIGST